MRNHLFLSVLCMGIGGHFMAYADAAKPRNNNQKVYALNTNAQKPPVRKPPVAVNPVRAKVKNIPNQEKRFHHHSSSSSMSNDKQQKDTIEASRRSEKISTRRNELQKAWLSKREQLGLTQSLNISVVNAINGHKFIPKVKHGSISLSPNPARSHKHKSHKKCTCLKKHILSQKDFINGVVITKSGYYCISEDIYFSPLMDNVAAITIRADNVTIDFETHVLRQSATTFGTFDNVSGVVIDNGFNFIKIFNGQILGFSDQGIIADSLNLEPTDHHDIVVTDMSVGRCGKLTTQSNFGFGNRGGITILGVTDCVIERCDVFEIVSQFDTEAIAVFFCNNVRMSYLSSHENESDPSVGLTVGITVSYFSNATNENCVGFDNRGGQAFGNSPYVGESLTMKSCSGNGNTSLLDDAADLSPFGGGIAVYFTNGAVLTDCEGNYNQVSEYLSNRPAFVTGIQIAESQGIVLDYCTANYNFATGTTVGGVRSGTTGFDINTCSAITLRYCTSTGNSAITQASGEISAFDCDFSDHVLYENCSAIENFGQVVGYGNVTGFYSSIRPEGGFVEDIIYRNCVAVRQSSNIAGTVVAGFLAGEAPGAPWTITNNRIVLDNCISQSNVNTSTPETGYGVFFAETTTNSSVSKCKLMGNGIGILLSGADTMHNMVVSNQILDNTVYGILDTTGNLNSYAKNYAYNVTNFTGLPAGTPIRNWVVGSPPSPVNNNGVTDSLDNFNVTNL